MSNMHDSPSTYNDFQKRGIPGEYYGMQIFSGSAAENPDVYYTGSKFGAAAFIVGTGSATIHPVGGGAIAEVAPAIELMIAWACCILAVTRADPFAASFNDASDPNNAPAVFN